VVLLPNFLGGTGVDPSGSSVFSQMCETAMPEKQAGTDAAVQRMYFIRGGFPQNRICVGKCISGEQGRYTDAVWRAVLYVPGTGTDPQRNDIEYHVGRIDK